VLLRRLANDKQLQESVNKVKDCSKDNFFGIWADKQQDIHAYMRAIRYGCEGSKNWIEEGKEK